MARNVVTRALLVLVGTVILLAVVIPVPVQAASTALIERDGEPVIVTLNGLSLVDRGDVVDDVWIANGRATVNGRVEGNVIILNGDTAVRGSVGGDIIVVRGEVWIGPEATVGGDIQASEPITVSEGAVVEGTVEQTSVVGGVRTLVPVLRTALWVGLTVALFALGFLAMRLAGGMVDSAGDHLTARPFGSAVRGLVALVLIPLLGIITLATIIGGLLGLLLLAIAMLAAVAGLIVASTAIGRWILPWQSRLLAFAIGAVVLRIVALVPVVGDLVTVIAALFGTGALLLALRDGQTDDEAEAAPTDTDPSEVEPALAASAVTDPTAGPGNNLDLRPGHGAPVLDVREDDPAIEVPDDQPLFTEESLTDAPRPEILASLPVREDHFADDPQGVPGNGVHRSLFADAPEMAATPSEAPVFTEPAAHTAGGPGYQGPIFTEPEPDPTRMPTTPAEGTEPGEHDVAPPETDTLTRPPRAAEDRFFADEPWIEDDDPDLASGGLFSEGGRAWRPTS